MTYRDSAASSATAASNSANAAATDYSAVYAQLNHATTGLPATRSAVTTESNARAAETGVLNAQWTLKAVAARSDGRIVLGAIGVAAAANNAGTQSEIILQADKLTFVPSGAPNATTQPLLTTGTRNGAAALVITAALIGDASIGTAQVGVLTAQNLTVGAISNVINGGASAGARVEITANRIRVYDSSNVLRVQLGDLS